jgi:nucleoside-diphosphate-sugar epimerase
MILVTGGTGLVGSHLLWKLSQTHQSIRAIYRDKRSLEKTQKVFRYYGDNSTAEAAFQKIEWIEADLNDIPALEIAFQNVEEVYHCAAKVSFDPKDVSTLRKINIKGTANIVNLCIAFKVEKLCHVSSIASLGNAKNAEPVTEELTWNPAEDHNDYAISKYGAEIEVWRGSQEGLKVIIVNPGVIIGPGFWDSGSGQIFRKIDTGLKYHFPKVTGFIGVLDVVDIMHKLMKTDIKNQQFILVAENRSFREVFDLTAEQLKKPKPNTELKKWMIALGWIFQKLGSFFGRKRNITRSSIQGLFTETRYSNRKVKELLDYNFTSLQQVIAETSKFYKNDH